MIVAFACLGLCGFGGVEQELDEQIDKLNAEVKKLDGCQTNGVTKICGISIGDTLDDIMKNNIFDKDPTPRKLFDDGGNITSIHGVLAKPFRQFFCAEVFFTPSGKARLIQFSMPAENFTQVRAEAEQIVPILQKHFGEKLGRFRKPQNNNECVKYLFDHDSIDGNLFPATSFLRIWSEFERVDPVFGKGTKVLYMDVGNKQFELREKALIALRELEDKKAKLKKTDEGIDAL